MKPLVIHAQDVQSGETWLYLFDRGPVLIGRGEGVALKIARPFVSMQHGTFDFTDERVRYLDLDSRNGTLIDEVPVMGGEREIGQGTRIRIGRVQLTVSRTPPATPAGDPEESPFARPPAGPAPR